MLAVGQDWQDLGKKELEAQRDPSALFRMPMARFAALYLQRSEEDQYAELNARRKAKGLRPVGPPRKAKGKQ